MLGAAMEGDPTAWQLALASAVVAVGAFVQGAVGFGVALIAAPVLLLIHPLLVPGPMICAGFALTVGIALRDRRSMDLSGMSWAIAGRLPGTGLAAVAVATLPERPLTLLIAALILLGVGLSAVGLPIPPTRWTLLGSGALSGFMGTASSVGGPPVALLYQHHPGPVLRGTLSGFFVVGSSISLVALALVGRFGAAELRASAALLPGIGLGFVLSRRAALALDRGHTRRAVLALSAAAGVAVVVRQIV